MMVIINNIGKKYKTGRAIMNKGSHYARNNSNTIDEIIINLSQIQIHADINKISVEHILIQHIVHETIHKLLHNNIGETACTDFDNIASKKAHDKCGSIVFNKWSNGFYDGSM